MCQIDAIYPLYEESLFFGGAGLTPKYGSVAWRGVWLYFRQFEAAWELLLRTLRYRSEPCEPVVSPFSAGVQDATLQFSAASGLF